MEDLSAKSKSGVRAGIRGAGRLSPDAAREASRAIERAVESLPEFRGARTILGFLPLADEPDVSGLLARAINGGRGVALPAVDWKARRMEAVEVRDLVADVVETRHGVREPRAGLTSVGIDQIDTILVPGLAFDMAGVRLGRGGGFYDRFLASPGLHARKIGVAFGRQIVARLPRDAHDVSMDLVVTEREVIRL